MTYTKETRERETTSLYQTHYYKTSYESLKQAITEHLERKEFIVSEFNDDYGEAVATMGRFSITIKIIMQNPRETSIDFFIEYYGLFGKKKVDAFLTEVYSFLDKKFELKGLSLHKDV